MSSIGSKVGFKDFDKNPTSGFAVQSRRVIVHLAASNRRPLQFAASDRRGNNLKGFKNFCQKWFKPRPEMAQAKARKWANEELWDSW